MALSSLLDRESRDARDDDSPAIGSATIAVNPASGWLQSFAGRTVRAGKSESAARFDVRFRSRPNGVTLDVIAHDEHAPISRAQYDRVDRVSSKLLDLVLSTANPDPDMASTDLRVAADVLERILPLMLQVERQPSFFPLADGGILVRWKAEDQSLDIEFDTDGDVVVVIKSGPGQRSSGFDYQVWGEAVRWLSRI